MVKVHVVIRCKHKDKKASSCMAVRIYMQCRLKYMCGIRYTLHNIIPTTMQGDDKAVNSEVNRYFHFKSKKPTVFTVSILYTHVIYCI